MILTRTISVPELLWTLWCTPGLIYLLKLELKAFKDWRWVVQNKFNGVREYASINSVLVFSTMTLTQLVFVVAGLIAMMLPPPSPETISPLTYVLTGLFVFASATKSILAAIISTRYDNLVERIEDGRWVVTDKERENEANVTPN